MNATPAAAGSPAAAAPAPATSAAGSPAVVAAVEGLTLAYSAHHERLHTLKDLLARGRLSAGRRRVVALDGVDLRIGPGEAIGLVGANGAGKSTLLRCLAGVLRPTSGRVRVAGRPAAVLDAGVGFHPDLTGRENLALQAGLMDVPRRRVRACIDEALEMAGAAGAADAPAHACAAGVLPRLALSLACAVEPRLLLVDEVLGATDAEFRERFAASVGRLRDAGTALVVAGHDLHTIRTLCDRVVVLSQGTVVADDEADAALTRYAPAAPPIA